MDVSQSTFSKNTARDGASIYNLDGSTLTITNSTYPAKSVYIQNHPRPNRERRRSRLAAVVSRGSQGRAGPNPLCRGHIGSDKTAMPRNVRYRRILAWCPFRTTPLVCGRIRYRLVKGRCRQVKVVLSSWGLASSPPVYAPAGEASTRRTIGRAGIDRSCRVTGDRLNTEVAKVYALFNKPAILSAFDTQKDGAASMSISTASSPKRWSQTGEKLKVSVLAVPVGIRGELPLVSGSTAPSCLSIRCPRT